MSAICIIALSQNRFKIFSLCRYKATGTAASRSCRSAPGRPAPITTKKTASRKPLSRRMATDLSPFLVLPGVWLKVSQMDSPLPSSRYECKSDNHREPVNSHVPLSNSAPFLEAILGL